MISLLANYFLCGALQVGSSSFPLLLAPVGASAVLVFTAPESSVSQPWPVIAGSMISATFGVAIAHLVADPAWAAAIAVSGAILITSGLRCLHPPGGAAALLAVVGGPVVHSQGYWFAVTPIGINATILVGTAIVFRSVVPGFYSR
ncbi:MAG: hypothetical protein EOO77_00900 [Oxalobacteraceae bacterium]|nr:MAG: hypothetical protein EOO77_00900 [Oxalobacteraceae bacterium]